MKSSIAGYTTGVFATAAAASAVRLLLFDEKKSGEIIQLPSGEKADIPIASCLKTGELAVCSTIKTGDGDVDATRGIKITAQARLYKKEIPDGVVIAGGKGIGKVTEKGLPIEVGQPAINPVPRQMIIDEARKLIKKKGDNQSVKITILAEDGEAIAKKTFNPKLGIEGGISIIGTTGIVRPMSDDSWKQSLIPQIDMAQAAGFKRLILTFGNLGEQCAIKLGFPKRQIIQMSNFVGFIIKACEQRNIERIQLIGHLGKIIKVADGHLNTHSGLASQNLKIIYELAKDEQLPNSILDKISSAKSSEAIITSIKNVKGRVILDKVALMAKNILEDYSNNALEIGVAITDLSGNIIGTCNESKSIIAEPMKWVKS